MTDKELKKITLEFTKGLTKGNIDQNCFVISFPLSGYLSFLGVENEMVKCEVKTSTELWEHYYIQLSDGRILDPTAGQFAELNLSKVYIGKLPQSYLKLSNSQSRFGRISTQNKE